MCNLDMVNGDNAANSIGAHTWGVIEINGSETVAVRGSVTLCGVDGKTIAYGILRR